MLTVLSSPLAVPDWPHHAERLLALSAAARAREHDQIAREETCMP